MMSANFSGGSYGILPLYIRHGGYFHQSFTEYLLSLFNWSELTSTCLLHPPSVGTTKQILKTLRQEQPCTLILLKATLFILIKLKMIDRHRHWWISTVFTRTWKFGFCLLQKKPQNQTFLQQWIEKWDFVYPWTLESCSFYAPYCIIELAIYKLQVTGHLN